MRVDDGHMLTLERALALVKVMKLNDRQIKRLVFLVLEELKSQGVVTFKAAEEKVREQAASYVRSDFHREMELESEVNKMLDDLERQNPGEFSRYKMFSMLKRKLAKEKGVIL